MWLNMSEETDGKSESLYSPVVSATLTLFQAATRYSFILESATEWVGEDKVSRVL